MDLLTTLKTLYVLGIVLLLASALGLALWTWRARQAGAAGVYGRLLHRPRLFWWLLIGLCLVAMPFTGWWLVHLAGWPLGQAWILGSSVLYTAGAFGVWWLVARLNRLRRGEAVGLRFTLALAVFGALCFLAIAGLTVARPV